MSGTTGESRRRLAPPSKGGALPGRSAARKGRIEILLVDPRPWTREALARALETGCRDFRVQRLADIADLERAELPSGPALALLDIAAIRAADPAGSTAAAALRTQFAGLPIVLLSDGADAEEIVRAVEQGLNGYIPMSLELRLVIDALRFVAAGGTFVPAEPFLASFDTGAAAEHAPSPSLGEAARSALATDTGAVAAAVAALTPRERAVLDWVCQGKSNKEIARALGMREATVKVHVRHIMRKLGASNRTQVALLAEGLERIGQEDARA